jgi:hypothetical protein
MMNLAHKVTYARAGKASLCKRFTKVHPFASSRPEDTFRLSWLGPDACGPGRLAVFFGRRLDIRQACGKIT